MSPETNWENWLEMLTEQAHQRITSQPEYLLEHAGGPYRVEADLIYARLIGHDEQVDADWRIPKIESVLLRPVLHGLTALSEGQGLPRDITIHAAEYDLQSNWATTSIDGITAFDADCPVKPGPPDFLVRLLFLRYKRRAPSGSDLT